MEDVLAVRRLLFSMGFTTGSPSWQEKLHNKMRFERKILMVCFLLAAFCCVVPLAGWAAPPAPPYEEALNQFQSGKFREATATLHQALDQHPKSAAFELLLARCYYELTDFDSAATHAESAVRLDPSNSEAHLWLGRIDGRRAEKGHSLSLALTTRKEFEKAVSLDSRNLDARRSLMEFYAQAPWIIGGSKDKAHKQATSIAALDPLEGALAQAHLDDLTGKDDQAAAEYHRVIKMKPHRVGPYFAAADFYLRHHNWQEAKDAIEAALKTHTPDPRLDYYRGVQGVLNGSRLQEAEQELKAYLQHFPRRQDYPSQASALDWLGRLYERWGKTQLAAQQYEAALRLNPDFKPARDALERLKQTATP